MKIYHKKNFTFGLFALFLAALNLVLNLQQGFNWKDGALIALLCLLGAASLIRSLSQKYSHTDKVEELDERNRLVKLKSRSQAYYISQFVFLSGEIALCAWGKINDSEPCIYLGLGLMLAFFISLITDFFTWIYYDEYT